MLDYHNFVLKNYFKAEAVDFQKTLDDTLALAERLKPMVADVPRSLYEANKAGEQPAVRGRAGHAARHRPRHLSVRHLVATASPAAPPPAPASARSTLHYVLGITKAYTTRVGSGPFPTELVRRRRPAPARDAATSSAPPPGAPRRCGWFDAAALKRSIQINGVSGLCVTKLDVLDGMETVRVGVGYKIDGEVARHPAGRRRVARRRASRSTRSCRAGARARSACRRSTSCRKSAQTYLKRMEALCDVPVDMISTGPDREETIVLRHPFEA